MAKIKIFLIFFLILFQIIPQVLAHVCDNVLRDDPIVVWPEKEIVEIAKTGQFKIFLRNEYWDSIHNVKIITPPSPFEIFVNPVLIERIAPGEKVSFLVNLTIPEKMEPGNYPLLMKIDAREFEITRNINLTIRVKPLPPSIEPQPEPLPEPKPQPEPKAVVEIIPEEISVAISVFPDEIDIRPGQSSEFKVFIRSGYDKPLHNITLLIEKGRFEMKVTPEIIKELRAGETKFFLVRLKVPDDIKFGEYITRIDFKADEFPLKRHVCEVLIRVGEVWDWKTYLYLVVTLVIIFILIWRWRKLTQKPPKPLPGQ